MKSFEALEIAVNKKTAEFAKRLRLSTSLVHKWTEPSTDFTDSGALNPLDRVEHIIETSLALGNLHSDAYAPLQYLTERFGLIILNLPKSDHSPETIQKELLETISDFGELAEESGRALQDGRLNAREALKIEKEAWELIRQTAAFMQIVKESCK